MDETLRGLVGRWRAPAYSCVALRDVRVYYGRQIVLSDLDLRIEAGTSVALMGANGAGKSTVLRVLSTLLPVDHGDVVVGDKLSYRGHARVIRPTIGLIAHEPMLYEDLSARENLELWTRLYGGDLGNIGAWLSAVGLADARDQLVGRFSRGMKQRLALARAMLHEPTLILMDEVLTGLDHASRRLVWQLLEVLREAGRMIVLATHVFDHPHAAITRGVVLRHGRVALDAPATEGLFEVYRRGTRLIAVEEDAGR